MNNLVRSGWVLLVALSLTGCGTVKEKVNGLLAKDVNEVPIRELGDINQTIEIKKRWSTSIGDGTDGYYLKLMPVAGYGVIYAAEREGVVTAISTENGKQQWKNKTKKPITGGPGLGEGMVLLGTRDGEVIALNEEDGQERWTSQVSSEVLAAPKVDLGVVVVRTGDGKVFGLDSGSGQRLWVYERAVPLLTLRGTSAPQLSAGLAIIGFDGGILTALDIATGAMVWEKRVALPSGRSTLERMVDIDAEPVLSEGVIFVATFQGRVAVVEMQSGRIAWVRDISSNAGLSVDPESVYVTDEQSSIWALERYSGNSVWKNEELTTRSLTSPTRYRDFVVAGDVEGYLHWMDRTDGSLVGRVRVDKSKIIAAPFVVDDMLFVYSSDGELSAYQTQ